MAFEWVKKDSIPHVTISKTGIALDRAALEAMDFAELIIVGINKGDRELGLKPHENEEEVATYQVGKERLKNGWVRINNKDLLRYIVTTFELTDSTPYRYVPEQNGTMLIIKVDNFVKK